jgi:hypothetical protein
MKKTLTLIPTLAMCLMIAYGLYAEMHRQQPRGLPPLPPAPAPRQRTNAVRTVNYGYIPQWPQTTKFLTLSNQAGIRFDDTLIIRVSDAQWQILSRAYPEQLTKQHIHFYQ